MHREPCTAARCVARDPGACFRGDERVCTGIVQLSAPKGTLPHRTIGWLWVALMVVVGVSSFFIHQLRLFGPWSPIHLLSIFTLVALPLAVLAAHRHAVDRHRSAMISIFVGALVVAGLLTFVPGRLMHAVAFGS